MNRGLSISPPIVYGPSSEPPCSTPAYAWTVAKSNIFCCDLFFVSGQNCQRDVMTHEHFHVVGLGHGEDKQGKSGNRASMTTEQALNSSDNMAQLVSELATGNTDACPNRK